MLSEFSHKDPIFLWFSAHKTRLCRAFDYGPYMPYYRLHAFVSAQKQHKCQTQTQSDVCSPQSSDYWFSTTNIPKPILWVLCFSTLKPPRESTSSSVHLLILTKRRKHCTKQDCKYKKLHLIFKNSESRHCWALSSVRIQMKETFSAPSLLFFHWSFTLPLQATFEWWHQWSPTTMVQSNFQL